MLNTVAIIPARMGSTRFPGKPLAKILELSMIEHVRRRVALSPLFSRVVVATCDEEIRDEVERYGGEVIMTSPEHQGCVDRIAEACISYQADIVVNVQGDEPLVHPSVFELLLQPFSCDSSIYCTNLISPIDERDFLSPNTVKVVRDLAGNFIYLSREPIPSTRKGGVVTDLMFKQLGIIAFRKDFLIEFNSLPRTPLEIIESVDMLRAVEHGRKVRAIICKQQSIGVDTLEDLERALVLMKDDSLYPQYKNQ